MVHNVLPDRKLVVVAGRDPSTLPADAVKKQAVLALWYVEEQVKKRYASLVGRLEKGSFDTVENFKRVCMTIMAVSARGRPRVSLMTAWWWLTACPGLLLLLLVWGGSMVGGCMQELLEAKPEQEAALLSALVNKLGDVDKKVGS